jgi:hypothetical protein
VLFIVQSPYLFTIGHRGVFSLARWAGQLHTGFHEPHATLERLSTPISPFVYGTITRSGATFQTLRLGYFSSRRPQPQAEAWFGLLPVSLAATHGIDVSFFSSRYLDVSVPWVRSIRPIHSAGSDWLLHQPGFPIRKSTDQRLVTGFPWLIAGSHVLRRLSMPRHPPYTLSSLITFIDHRHSSIADCRFAIAEWVAPLDLHSPAPNHALDRAVVTWSANRPDQR